jgi:ligand-binding sensor domain-containing protein
MSCTFKTVKKGVTHKAFWAMAMLLCLPVTLFSQDPFFRKISYSEGLPSSIVFDLMIAKNGRLFLGTEIGLVTFDGVKFKTFPFSGNKGNSIDRIKESKSGKIWCMNFSNQIFQVKNDTLINDAQLSLKIQNSDPLRGFTVINEDIWVITDSELFVRSKGQIRRILKIQTTNALHFQTIDFDEIQDQIVVSTQQNIYLFDKGGNLKMKKNIQILHSEFAFTDKGIFSVEKLNIKNIQLAFNNLPIRDLDVENVYTNRVVYEKENIWLCTNNGLYIYNLRLNRFTQHYFSNIRISDLQIDQEGGYWISSVEKGLMYVPDWQLKKFNLSQFNLNRVSYLNNKIWVGSGDGTIFKVNPSGIIEKSFPNPYKSEVEFIQQVDDHIITSHGVIENDQLVPIRFGKNIACDDRNNMLMCTYNKAIMVHRDFISKPNFNFIGLPLIPFTKELKIPGVEVWPNRTRVAHFHSDEKQFYIGAADALIRFDPYKQKFQNILYRNQEIIAPSICIQEDDNVVVATIQYGLLFIRNGVVLRDFGTKHGLSSNTCKKVKFHNNHLFVLTDKGIDVIDLKTNEVTHLTNILALSGVGIFDFDLKDDEIWLATSEGLLRAKWKISKQKIAPKIYNLSVSSNGNKLLSKQLNFTKNNIAFDVETIHYKSLGNFNYEYRLLGLDSVWSRQHASSPLINFLSLPPNNYEFQIRTVYNNVRGNTKIFNFTIAPPFWNTWWFLSFLGLLVGIIVYTLVKMILHSQRKKQLIRERLIYSQLTALRAQMNPHFIFNVLNSVQGLIYANKKTEASNYLGKFSNLMRNTLENSTRQFILIQDEIELLQQYLELESSRFDNDFEFNINHDFDNAQLETEMPSMILQPFVENAVKHGLLHLEGHKTLYVTFKTLNHLFFQVIIEDNGIGRVASMAIQSKRKQHKSFATNAIDSRIELLNRTLNHPISIYTNDLNEDTQIGTKVVLKIPFNHESIKSTHH